MKTFTGKEFCPLYPLAVLSLLWIGFLAGASAASSQDFTLQSVTGTNQFKLSEARGKFVALHFLLKTECPYCLRHTHSYATQAAKDPRVLHIFIKPDTDIEIKRWAARLGAGTPALDIYLDPEARLAKAFNIPDGYRFHGQVVHYPALVLLDPKGKEVFRFVGKSNADRLPYEKFAARLDELAATAKGGSTPAKSSTP